MSDISEKEHQLEQDYQAALALLDAAEALESLSSSAKSEKADAFGNTAAAFTALGDYKSAARLAEQAQEEAALWREKAGINTVKAALKAERARSPIGQSVYFTYNKLGRARGLFRIVAIAVVSCLFVGFLVMVGMTVANTSKRNPTNVVINGVKAVEVDGKTTLTGNLVNYDKTKWKEITITVIYWSYESGEYAEVGRETVSYDAIEKLQTLPFVVPMPDSSATRCRIEVYSKGDRAVASTLVDPIPTA